jgi:catechol 2,3-dioxygenase-like lactoylglutathione lyase family enzyme
VHQPAKRNRPLVTVDIDCRQPYGGATPILGVRLPGTPSGYRNGGRAVLTGLAHTAICVPDVEEAARWYAEVLGLTVLSPPYRMAGTAIEQDMGELIPRPVVVKAAIVGLAPDDRVLELIEYPEVDDPAHRRAPGGRPDITRPGLTHVGLTCDDIESTRNNLEERGVQFLTRGIAEIAGLRSTWFVDPWGVVFILVEKSDDERPYWKQPLPRRS